MPSKEMRRVQEIGGVRKSRAVTLPKAWADYSDLRQGDEVAVFCDGVVVIVPPGRGRATEKRVRRFLEGEAELPP
jgi:bifunctional DNA-binding transcriptional regulator/antitoxin component of YhaV-PrlF toxin-antitoxin module